MSKCAFKWKHTDKCGRLVKYYKCSLSNECGCGFTAVATLNADGTVDVKTSGTHQHDAVVAVPKRGLPYAHRRAASELGFLTSVHQATPTDMVRAIAAHPLVIAQGPAAAAGAGAERGALQPLTSLIVNTGERQSAAFC